MKLLEIYSALQGGHITTEEAARTLGITVRDLKFRVSRWGNRLPTLCAALDMISENKATRDEAAALIGVSVRQVNHLMETWKIRRPTPKYVIDSVVAEIKWEIRKKYAIEFIGGYCSLDDAATEAGVSNRQMRRWVADLLDEHFGMAYKDLRELTGKRRAQLAEQIEETEGFEYAKRAVLQSIRRGETTLEEEAAARIARGMIRKGQYVRRKQTPKP
jgi:hypothetical protein